jgi:hypothetical protein
LRRAQIVESLVCCTLLGQHEPKVQFRHCASGSDRAFVGRFRFFSIAEICQQVPEARTSLWVPPGLSPPERIPGARRIAAPLQREAKQHGALSIVQLVGFPVRRLSAGEIPHPFALLTARYSFLGRHSPPI